MDRYTGDGSLLIVGVRIQSLLKRLVGIGIDPVVFHLLQRRAVFNFFLQGQELIIAGYQCKTMGNGIQCTGFISEVTAQLAGLQPNPRIVRFLRMPFSA